MNLRLRFLFFFLLSGYFSVGQNKEVVKVGTGEYFTSYLTVDGKLFATAFKDNKYKTLKVPVDSIKDVDGAQYTNIALDSNGRVFITGIFSNGALYAKQVNKDAYGNPFVGNDAVFGWYQAYLTLKEGDVYMWGEDILGIQNGFFIEAPIKLEMPKGKKFKKLVPLTMGSPSLMGLATDSSVWIWGKNKGTPEKVKLARPAINIAGVGAACYVVETIDDLLAWGYLGSYLGVPDFSTSPISIRKKWTIIGCKFPSKELIGNYNTLHIIDANNNMFGAGENIMGEVGNGNQYPNWKNYSPTPFAWSWNHNQMVIEPVQIPGKFQNLCTSNSITFYFYVQDMTGQWYSWGRNKARSLGNGITLNPQDESNYPNALGVPAPARVEPLNVHWKVIKFHKDSVQYPIANAGVNQIISSHTVMLDANLSSQNGGSIVSWKWKQVEGIAANLSLDNKPQIIVSNLKAGNYVFELTIVANNGLSASDRITISVTP